MAKKKSVEAVMGVHSMERTQADQKKTTAEQYAEFHKLNNHPFVSTDKTIDKGSRGKMVVLKRK